MEGRAGESRESAISRRIADQVRRRDRGRPRGSCRVRGRRNHGPAMTADSPLAPSRNLATLVAAAVLGLATLVWQASTSAAHEVRPSYLELRELSSGEFAVLLKTPMNGDLRL